MAQQPCFLLLLLPFFDTVPSSISRRGERDKEELSESVDRGPWQPGNVCCAWSPWDVGSWIKFVVFCGKSFFPLSRSWQHATAHSGYLTQSCQLSRNGSLCATNCRTAPVTYIGRQSS
ncbi:hypothetical protein F5883DRAFT_534877, partial [Diaporthe sp. PMI_573]